MNNSSSSKSQNSSKSNRTKSDKTNKQSGRFQPKKDSKTKRVNYDNTRESKFSEDVAAKADAKQIDKVGKGYTKPAVSPTNHDEFWNKNPEMLKAAGSLSFATIAGTTIPLNVQTGPFRIPGIMQIAWTPSIGGFAPAEQDAVQQSSISTYSFMVHANSRDYSYEAADNMIMILGADHIFCIITAMARAFGVAQDYIEPNLNRPDGILTAMGFDPQDVRHNLSQMWWDINELINRSKQLWVPHTMPILDRWLQLNSGYYTDDATMKAQYYVFVQNLYWKFAIDSQNGSQLIPVTVKLGETEEVFTPATKTYPWATWVAAANSMFNALLGEEDRGIIYGDILNAYGASHIFAMSSMPNDFKIVPAYDPVVLSQIENLTTCFRQFAGQQVGCYTVGVSQNAANGTLFPVWNTIPTNVNNVLVSTDVGLLNWHFEGQPDPMQVMKMTRLMELGQYYAEGPTYTNLIVPNTETGIIFTNTKQLFPYSVGTEQVQFLTVMTRQGITSSGVSYTREVINAKNQGDVQSMEAFDWHPFVYPSASNQTLPTSPVLNSFYGMQITNCYGDYSNYTTIGSNNLSKLNRTALFSAFGVPQA